MSVKAGVIELTPQKASELLQRNTHNRSVSTDRVEQYSADMRKGAWQVNGEAIKISADGQILDGQHRLLAVLDSDATIQTLVITGLAPEAQETMDQGRSRNFADVLRLRGEGDYCHLSVAVRAVCLYERDGVPFVDRGRVTPTVTAMSRTLERNPDIRSSVKCARESYRPWISLSMMAALHYLFATVDQEAADEFVDRLATGENLSLSSPIYVLRERLVSEHARNDQRALDARVKTAFVVLAWNAWRDGHTIHRLQWNRSGANPDAFPRISGLSNPDEAGAQLAEAA